MAEFSKTPKTHEEQLAILEGRGLRVADRESALHRLAHINYYRLSAYRLPLTAPGEPDRFRPGAAFEDLCRLYDFDQSLRRIVLDASERVEVSVRASWAYALAHRHGAFAYEDPGLFRSAEEHAALLRRLDEELERSREEFVAHFRSKHGLRRPPVWAASEVLSFGLASRFLSELKHSADRQEVARGYGLDERILVSFLHHLTVVRNHAAHHARLWNRRFAITFQIPRRPERLRASLNPDPVGTRRVYNTLAMLVELAGSIDPEYELRPALLELLRRLAPEEHGLMGFPPDWESRPIWNPRGPR
ncbi:MAG: Abi family protein [Candidatus Sumerlaeia bacterium]|nr:Abi family protein [Candidatus Sumerlaeia bacterium]